MSEWLNPIAASGGEFIDSLPVTVLFLFLVNTENDILKRRISKRIITDTEYFVEIIKRGNGKVSSSIDASSRDEISCRVTNSVLKYLEFQGYDVDVITAGLPHSKEHLTDPLNWTTYEVAEAVCRRAAKLTNNDMLMYQAGLSTPKLNPLGGIEYLIKMLTGPKTVYRFIARFATLFNRVGKFKTTFNGHYQATITMDMSEDYPPLKDVCDYVQGILASIPTYWGLPAAEVQEKKCMCKPEPAYFKDDVEYEAKACEFEVHWQPPHSWYKRMRDNLSFRGMTSSVKDLEQKFRFLDQKNAELVARNRQLATVRELAISIDSVRTIDEALSLAVEQAREIDGVRFILVQKLDEAGEFVTTPYYSKFRNKYIVSAIKALGFDPEKELGENPTSKKLRFRFSKLKAAQDYIRNPRAMVFPSLAELLDGIWPRPLCEGIQRIMGVKKLVVVPLIIDGKSWGNMLYFLTKEVPTDILEMIGAHCAIAVKNILTFRRLEKGNQEAELARDKLEKSITKQKHIETELRQSEEYARTLANSLGIGLFVVDAETHEIVDANPAAIKQTGLSKDQMLGHICHAFVCPADKGKCPVLDLRQTVDFSERVLLTANGERLPIIKSVVPVTMRGRKYLLESFVSIKVQKRMEAELIEQKGLVERVLATIPNAVFLLDRNLQVIMANQAAYNVLKINNQEPANNLTGKSLKLNGLNQMLTNMINRGENSARIEFRHAIAEHERLLCADMFATLKNELLLVINDITEERERQERLYLTDRLASVGEMASGVAHELNNPLTSIIGLSNLLIEQETLDDTDAIKEDPTAIHSEAKRCAAIVKNLLAFARRHTPTRQPLNVANILEDVLKLRAYEHKSNNIAVKLKFPPYLPEVLADYFQMQQVFLNIVLNAETAMTDAHGRGTLEITGEFVNDHIRISFTDDGPGIPKENLRLIFNPFFTTKEVGKGTGLGLSICYGIVTAHGGKIYARSNYGQGATFIIELPVNAVK